MALIRINKLTPPFWLPNGHLQTVYPALFRKVEGVTYQRERLVTTDGDFLLLDWCISLPGKKSSSLAILSHGFEGDSQRPYIKGMVKSLVTMGIDCLAWNYRSCGGVMNKSPQFYHSGATDDLQEVIDHALKKEYQQIFLVGFSLGGNLTLKYLGEERRRPKEIKKAVCYSVPLDLEACSLNLNRFSNRVYQRRFLRSVQVKIREKSLLHPNLINTALLKAIRSVYTFDDLITAPLHGFKNASDYYSKCSAKNFLLSINIPTRIIHAENDPMIPVSSLPFKELETAPQVEMLLTLSGGHCGFLEKQGNSYWSEKQTVDFFRA